MTKVTFSSDWLIRLTRFNRLFVGFSGGVDSTVLLHLLATQPTLCNKITAVHINHSINKQAANWETHCYQICQLLGLPLIVRQVSIAQLHNNIEEKARIARYTIFRSLLSSSVTSDVSNDKLNNKVCHQDNKNALILGHHRDDQAETLLLQLCRGAGVDGLSAMKPVTNFAGGQLLRPLLDYSRSALEAYASIHQLYWINDASNNDCSLSRNFLRHQVIPLLQIRWPNVTTNLARTAAHCLLASKQLNELANIDYPEINIPRNTLPINSLKHLSEWRINNVLRNWLKKNTVRLPDTTTFNRLIFELIYVREDATPKVEWGDYCIRRYQHVLYLLDKTENILPDVLSWHNFPEPLVITGLGVLKAIPQQAGLVIPLQTTIQVRFRKGGEVFIWHGQTKLLKKLFQEWRIPTWMRKRIPLIYINDQLAAVVGYAVSDQFYQTFANIAIFFD